MGGRGVWSMTAASSPMPPAGYTRYEMDVIGGRTVGEILDEAEGYGSITYEGDRHGKNLERDLFAHAALYLDGREFTVLKEKTSSQDNVAGGTNVDLMMHNGVYWEIKSPVAKGESSDPLHFVERNLEDAERNFRDDPRTERRQTRVIFNCFHTPVDDSLIDSRIERELARHRNIREVLVIHKDGSVKPLP